MFWDKEHEQENKAVCGPHGTGLLKQNRPAMEVHRLFRGLPDFNGDSRRGVLGLFWDSLILVKSTNFTRKMHSIGTTPTWEQHYPFIVSFPRQKPYRDRWKWVMLAERRRLDEILNLWNLSWRPSSQPTFSWFSLAVHQSSYCFQYHDIVCWTETNSCHCLYQGVRSLWSPLFST